MSTLRAFVLCLFLLPSAQGGHVNLLPQTFGEFGSQAFSHINKASEFDDNLADFDHDGGRRITSPEKTFSKSGDHSFFSLPAGYHAFVSPLLLPVSRLFSLWALQSKLPLNPNSLVENAPHAIILSTQSGLNIFTDTSGTLTWQGECVRHELPAKSPFQQHLRCDTPDITQISLEVRLWFEETGEQWLLHAFPDGSASLKASPCLSMALSFSPGEESENTGRKLLRFLQEQEKRVRETGQRVNQWVTTLIHLSPMEKLHRKLQKTEQNKQQEKQLSPLHFFINSDCSARVDNTYFFNWRNLADSDNKNFFSKGGNSHNDREPVNLPSGARVYQTPDKSGSTSGQKKRLNNPVSREGSDSNTPAKEPSLNNFPICGNSCPACTRGLLVKSGNYFGTVPKEPCLDVVPLGSSELNRPEQGKLMASDTGKPLILNLPNEILAHIFKYTTVRETRPLWNTCKRFRDAVSINGVQNCQVRNLYPKSKLAAMATSSTPSDSAMPEMNKRLQEALVRRFGPGVTDYSLAMQYALARWHKHAPTVCTHTLTGHTKQVQCIGVLPDGRVVSGSDDKTIKVWDLTKPNGEQCTHTLTGHTSWVQCIGVLPDGRVLSGSADGTIKVWDLTKPDGEQCTHTLTGHTERVQCIGVLPGDRVLSCSDDKTIKVWDLTKPDGKQCTHTLTGHTKKVQCIGVLPDGRVLSGSADKTIKVWDLTKPNGEQCTHTLTEHTNRVCCIGVLPDGRVLSGSDDKTIKVWDLTKPNGEQCTHTLTGHTDWVRSITVLSDGRVVSGSDDKTIKVWDLTKPNGEQCTHTLTGHTDWVRCIGILPDSRVLSGSDDKTIRVWDYPENQAALADSLNQE